MFCYRARRRFGSRGSRARADSSGVPSAHPRLRRRIPQRFQAPERGVMHHRVIPERFSPSRDVLTNEIDAASNVFQKGLVLLLTPHSGTASATIRSVTGDFSVISITLTLHPRASSRSRIRPLKSNSVARLSRSTTKSMSLSMSAVPLATEPKTRTLRAPRVAEMRRISSRLAASCASVGGPE
jgi:hypothetical protein